jgi:hypothetical protein
MDCPAPFGGEHMSAESKNQHQTTTKSTMPSLLMGAGLALASLVLVPAVAQRFGMSSSLTSALRVALMRASQKA